MAKMKPLFVSGLGRSGTTITARLLNSHPEVSMTVEKRIVNTMISYIKELDLNNWASLKANPHPFSYSVGSIDEWVTIRKALALGLRKGYELTHTKPKIKYYGDKFPPYYRYLTALKIIFPDFRMIICRRNMKDLVKSYTRQYWANDDWTKQLQFERYKLDSIIDGIKDNPNFFVLDLEELKKKPKATCNKLAKFLGLENKFNAKMIKGEG